jgi:hypothetical protein
MKKKKNAKLESILREKKQERKEKKINKIKKINKERTVLVAICIF